MNKLLWCLTLAVLTCEGAQASTAVDAENILNHSRFVDSAHPVRVSFSSDKKQVGVSLFAQHESGDQDCKITALLMTKELLQHYPIVEVAKISFYDEIAQSSSRFIVVSKAQVRMVDTGSKVQAVLSKLNVVRQNSVRKNSEVSVQAKTAVKADPVPASGWSNQNIYNSIRARRATVLAQTTVRVNAANSDWTPTSLAVKYGQVVWIDTKDDITASNLAIDDTNNIILNQPTGALFAKISAGGGAFLIEGAGKPFFAPGDGEIFLFINHSASAQQQQINAAKSVRIVISN